MLPVQSVSIHAIRLPLIILQYNLLVQTDNVLASHDCVMQFMKVDCCKHEPHIRHIQKHIERSRHANNEYHRWEVNHANWVWARDRTCRKVTKSWLPKFVLCLRSMMINMSFGVEACQYWFVLFCSSPYWKKMLAFSLSSSLCWAWNGLFDQPAAAASTRGMYLLIFV